MPNNDGRIAESKATLSMGHIVQTWWPLATSWLFMATEGPMMNGFVARLADSTINLAAWGGIVFPIALMIEAPIIMLLSASTALSRDWDAYKKLRRFMMWAGAILTAVHALIAFTPLYYFVATRLIGAPAELVEPARIGEADPQSGRRRKSLSWQPAGRFPSRHARQR